MQGNLSDVEVVESARKHGVTDSSMRHAIDNAIRYHNLDEGLVMIVGPALNGSLIEVGIVDETTIIHAMSARTKFL